MGLKKHLMKSKKEKELDVIKKKKVKYLPEYSVMPKVIHFLFNIFFNRINLNVH